MSGQFLLARALKEWAIAVNALAAGKTILLLRKGGIREESKNFQVESSKIWLYPTFEHQKRKLLKPQYRSQVQEVSPGWHPENISIQSYAEITHTLLVDNLETLEKLSPHHIWTQEMLCDRFKWKPQQPLKVLLLKVAKLPNPITLPYHQSYGGCRSWIDLQSPIDSQDVTPVLTEEDYQRETQKIIDLIELE